MIPSWVGEWLAAPPSSIGPHLAAELRQADDAVGELALRFPPFAVVAEEPAVGDAPASGAAAPSSRELKPIGYVTGYRAMPFGEVWLTICPEPGSSIAILASPGRMRVYGYRPGHGPGHVRALLGRTAA